MPSSIPKKRYCDPLGQSLLERGRPRSGRVLLFGMLTMVPSLIIVHFICCGAPFTPRRPASSLRRAGLANLVRMKFGADGLGGRGWKLC